jgi:hypothetical protein
VVAFAAAGIVVQHVSATPKGKVTLPGTLLGLPKATSAGARHLAAGLVRDEMKSADDKLSGIVAGVYGSPASAWFAIAGGGICGTCSAKSAVTLKNSLIAQGFTRAAAYPAGPKGGVLACGSKPAQGGTVIRCSWVDDTTAGDVIYAGGSASGLADAAAKTIRARAVIEH